MNAPDTYQVRTWREYGITEYSHTLDFFRWYWQANAFSWVMHHICGRSCNTYKRRPSRRTRR